jgi:FHS family Na+ dependent glucose MFS transporter 1
VLERGRLGKTAAYFVSFITLGFVIGIIGPTLPKLTEHTGTDLSRISLLFTTHSLGYLFGSLLGGHMYDRLKGHPIIAVAVCTMMVMMFLVPLISFLWVLAAILFVLGMAEGSLDVGANTLLVWVHGNRVGPFMNGLHFFFGLGALLSPLVVAQVLRFSSDIYWAYWILASVMFPLALLFFFLQSPEIQKPSQIEDSKGKDNVLVILLTVFFFLHVGAEMSFGGWIYSYAAARGLAGVTAAAYLNSVFWGFLTLGRLFGIAISTRLKPRTMILCDIAGCLIASCIILVWPKSAVVLWFGSALMGLSMASIFPTSVNFAERNMDITGRVTSWFFIGGSIGSMFFPWLVGQFFEKTGPQIMVIILLLIFLTAICILSATFVRASRLKHINGTVK